jgi:hypothetical protein
MKNIFKTDFYLLGIGYAILLPALFYGVIFLLKETDIVVKLFLNPKVPYFVALIPNLIVMRFLFVPYKLDKSGRGVLAVTFVLFMAVFVFIR